MTIGEIFSEINAAIGTLGDPHMIDVDLMSPTRDLPSRTIPDWRAEWCGTDGRACIIKNRGEVMLFDGSDIAGEDSASWPLDLGRLAGLREWLGGGTMPDWIS